MDILERQCKKCGEIKPLSEYYPRYHKVNQLEVICKVCKTQWHKEHRKMGKPQYTPKSPIVDTPNGKGRMCTSCNVVKSLKYFYPSKTAKEGYSTKCAECFRLNYRQNKDNQNLKALQRYYERQGKPMPEAVKQYNTRIIPADGSTPVMPTINIERFNAAREQWRAVFAERFDDIMKLLKDYDDDKPESRNLVLEFHSKVRSTWKLKHKTTERYEAHFRKYGSSGW